MPTNRPRRGHARRELGIIEAEHLQIGPDHLILGPCWICEGGIEAARAQWAASRGELLARWRLRYSFPAFAAIVLDGVPAAAPTGMAEHERDMWRLIQSARKAVAP